MAAFKLPSLSIKQRRHLEFPEFSWNSINKEELGSGTFGSLYLVDFNVAYKQHSVVVKKLKGESTESKRHF